MPNVRPITVAHRAANDHDAYLRAVSAGVDYAEGDVWLYRGRVEVRHLKTAGPLPVLWDRWRLRPLWWPRPLLSDVLSREPRGCHLLLDLKGKDPSLPEAVATLIQAAGAEGRVALASQGWRHLDALRERLSCPAFYSIGGRRQLARFWKEGRQSERPRVAVDRRFLDEATASLLRSQASVLIAWAVNSDSEARQVLFWGFDGVISDDIDLLRRLRDGEG